MRSLDELVNYTLVSKLGEPPIDSIDGTDNIAVAVQAVWPAARQSVFRRHSFNELVRRAVLPPLPDAPVYGFNYAFKLPANLVTVLDVSTSKNFDVRATDYTVEGDRVLTDQSGDEDGLYLRYVADTDDVSTFSPSLIECLSCFLGAQLIKPLRADVGERERLIQEFEMHLANAKVMDSREGTGPDFYEDDWVLARHRRRF